MVCNFASTYFGSPQLDTQKKQTYEKIPKKIQIKF